MKFADFYEEAILWTCYLENFPRPERHLERYGISVDDLMVFDHLGQFFPFNEFYVRGPHPPLKNSVGDLAATKKSLIIPWMYRPERSGEVFSGKRLVCPGRDLFDLLDNKIAAKNLFRELNIPTPDWTLSAAGKDMLEKPVQNSGGGYGIKFTRTAPGYNRFLEQYIPGCRSIGMQFFLYDNAEFICADEMLYWQESSSNFYFDAQQNVPVDTLPRMLIEDCFRLLECLLNRGYEGLIGIDALVGTDEYFLIEINPRGIGFLPVFFAGSSFGWTEFLSYMKRGVPGEQEITLLNLGAISKVIKKIS